MEFCKYKKDLNFSYTMGAFPTIELLQSKNYKTISVLVHSKYIKQVLKKFVMKKELI